jgi:hypothetical protein
MLYSTSVARPFRAVIKYVNFCWGNQWLCSAMVLNWCQNTAQDVVPSNIGGCAVLAQTPGPLPSSVLASAIYIRNWNSCFTASVSERVLLIVTYTLMWV